MRLLAGRPESNSLDLSYLALVNRFIEMLCVPVIVVTLVVELDVLDPALADRTLRSVVPATACLRPSEPSI